ncbi:UNVERIFIED_CONTAM: hypothetical protein Sindi_1819300, partial [Sesamum indicum]
NVWKHDIIGVPMYAITRKLKALKPVFRQQKRNKGDLSENVRLVKGFLEKAQILVSSDRQNDLFLLLEYCCRLVYAKTVKMEQTMLQQRTKMQWMKDGDQCSRAFFCKIAQRRATRRILQINDEHGTTYSEPGAVIHEFVSFYQALLGRERRKQVIDIWYLRPWARHVLNEEEGLQLLTPVTAVDVKQAVFDIAEDKAPEPDGFSSRFYKAAWPIMGPEVMKAILEFFTTGKLLKQINTTLLALIPMVDRGVCHDTLIFHRAEWKTSWFLYWIEMATARDPLSPYLFVLVMEVLYLILIQMIDQDMHFSFHWKCEPSRLFQLGFADDLLLFCKADIDSIGVFKQGLDLFASWSGLWLNVHKSHLIISRSAQEIREQLLEMLGFHEGHLPMRYLGLPLLSSRLSLTDCQPLLLKIDQRIKGWEGMRLSYAGRVQIIKSVLMALSIYWASAFILPKGILREIEKRLRAFLWKGIGTSGYAKVAWRDVCRPASEEGQGLRDIATLNRALMSKKLCDVIRCDRTSIWVEWLYNGWLRDKSVWTITDNCGSWGWRDW